MQSSHLFYVGWGDIGVFLTCFTLREDIFSQITSFIPFKYPKQDFRNVFHMDWFSWTSQKKCATMKNVKNYSDRLFIFQKENIVSMPEYIVRYKRHYTRQGEFKTGGTLRICVTLKTIWSYCTLINITLTWAHVHQ